MTSSSLDRPINADGDATCARIPEAARTAFVDNYFASNPELHRAVHASAQGFRSAIAALVDAGVDAE